MPLKSYYYLAKMWRNPWKPCGEIEKLQLKNLKAVITHAYENSPFYHEKYKEAGLRPEYINSLKDILKVPFTTKEELREAGKNVLTRDIPPRDHQYMTTSGSSGEKLDVIHSRDFRAFAHAIFSRIYLTWGIRPFKKVTYIRYEPLTLSLVEKLGILKLNYISTFLDMESQFDLLLKQNPHVLVGHPPDLIDMAKLALSRGITLNLDIVGSNSEVLTLKEREFLEKTFHCPVYEEYSAVEVGFVAQNCKKKRMHIISDSVILEILKEGEPVAPGEKGEVFVTSLFRNATPFIRYSLGDVASLSQDECDCGMTFPVIDSIEGRKDDFIVLPSGKEIPPTRIVPLFFNLTFMKEFAAVQTSPTKVIINIVPCKTFCERDREYLLQLVRKELTGMDIEIRCVEPLEKTAYGKKCAVINLVKKK
jgi:phenylacetate-CoA ligase